MALVLEGRNNIFQSYFQSKDLYVGLWSIHDINHKVSFKDISALELVKNEYKRQKIDKTLWSISNGILSYPTLTFSSLTQDWTNIKGYFISDTIDNTGNIILAEVYLLPINVAKSDYIDVNIKLTY